MSVGGWLAMAAALVMGALGWWYVRRGPEPLLPDKRKRAAFAVIMTALDLGLAAVLGTVYGTDSALFTLKRIFAVALLWPMAAEDMKKNTIPNLLLLAGLGIRAGIFVFELIFRRGEILRILLSDCAAAAAITVVCLLCMLIIKNSLGMGDLKLLALLGLFLGLSGIAAAVCLTLLASFGAAVVLLITKRKTRRDTIPFCPAVLCGTFLSVLLTGGGM